jgi:hypothetical protein
VAEKLKLLRDTRSADAFGTESQPNREIGKPCLGTLDDGALWMDVGGAERTDPFGHELKHSFFARCVRGESWSSGICEHGVDPYAPSAGEIDGKDRETVDQRRRIDNQ